MDDRWTSRALGAALVLAVTAGCGGGGRAPTAEDAAQQLPPPSPGEEVAPAAGNTFTDYGERAPTVTTDDPLSTFAVDVDTGSYSIGRQFIGEGSLPDPASVRLEEYVNAFDAEFAPAADAALALHADGGPAPVLATGTDTRVVRVGLTTQAPDRSAKKQAALTVVVDTSGSMAGDDRLGLAKEALGVLVRELDPTDTVAVVAYGSEAELELAPTAVDDRETILEAIDSLSSGGSTNAEAGLRLGYEQARAAFLPEGTNRVILISDGVANVGETGPDAILSVIGEEARSGIQLVTVGVGMGDYNDVLMEQLANHGDGFYSYIDSQAQAEELFGDNLLAALEVVAEETKLQVEFDPAGVSSYRLLGFENREVADDAFRDDLSEAPIPRADAGELGPGHTVTALYEVTLAPGTVEAAAPAHLATIRVRWTDPETGTTDEIERPVTTADLAGTWDDTAPRMQVAAVVAAWARALKAVPAADEQGAPATLAEVAAAARALPRSVRSDPDVETFIELTEAAAEM